MSDTFDDQEIEFDGGVQGALPTVVAPGRPTRAQRMQADLDNALVDGAQPVDGVFGAGTGAPQNTTGIWGDLRRSVQAGGAQMLQDLLAGAQWAQRSISEDPEAGAWLQRQQTSLQQYVEGLNFSPEMREARQLSIWGDEGTRMPSTGGEWGRYSANAVAELIPQIAMILIPSSILGRAAIGVAQVAGASGRAAGAAGLAARTGAAAGGWGWAAAGQAYDAIERAVMEATPQQLAESPAYQAAFARAGDDMAARRELLRSVANAYVPIALGAGVVGGTLLESAARPAMRAVGGSRAGSMGAITRAMGDEGATLGPRIAAGAGMGAAGEFVEEGGTQAAALGGVEAAGLPTTGQPSALTAGLRGAAGGALMGGVLHGALGPRPERPTALPVQMDPAVQAALTAAQPRPARQQPQGQTPPEAPIGPPGAVPDGFGRVPAGEGEVAPGATSVPRSEISVPPGEVAPLPEEAPTPPDRVTLEQASGAVPESELTVPRGNIVPGHQLRPGPAFARSMGDFLNPPAAGATPPPAAGAAAPSPGPNISDGAASPPTAPPAAPPSPAPAATTVGPTAVAGAAAPAGTVDAKIDEIRQAVVDGKLKLNVSAIQRQYRVGYNRAARIVEALKAEGVKPPEPPAAPAPAPTAAAPAEIPAAAAPTGTGFADALKRDAAARKAKAPVETGAQPAAVTEPAPAPAPVATLVDPVAVKAAELKAKVEARRSDPLRARRAESYLMKRQARAAAAATPTVVEAPAAPAAPAKPPKTAAAVELAKKRALAKQKLAATGERKKGAAFVAEGEAPDIAVPPRIDPPSEMQRAEQERRRAIREAMAEDRGRRGSGPARDASRLIEATDEQAAKGEVSEGDSRDLTDSVQDVESGTSAVEAEGSEGVASYESQRKERVEGSAKERQASDLLDKVLNGEMTAAEADTAYGRQPAGKAGRPWSYSSWGAWLQEELKRLEDPKTEKDLLAIGASIEANKRKMSKVERQRAERQMNALTARLDPDRVQLMRDLLDEMGLERLGPETPAKPAKPAKAPKAPKAAKAIETSKRRSKKTEDAVPPPAPTPRLDPASIPDVQMDLTPEQRAAIEAINAAAAAVSKPGMPDFNEDTPTTGRKRWVPGNTTTWAEAVLPFTKGWASSQSPYALLARQIARATHGITVDFVDGATIRRLAGGRNVRGFWDYNVQTMVIRADAADTDGMIMTTLLHEGIHAATYDALRVDPKLMSKVDRLRQMVERELTLDAFANPRIAYGLKNADEFLAMAMTDPDFQSFLDTVPVDKATAAQLGLRPLSTLWRMFVDLLRNILRLPTSHFSALEAVVSLNTEVMNVGRAIAVARAENFARYGSEVPADPDVASIPPIPRGALRRATDLLNKGGTDTTEYTFAFEGVKFTEQQLTQMREQSKMAAYIMDEVHGPRIERMRQLDYDPARIAKRLQRAHEQMANAWFQQMVAGPAFKQRVRGLAETYEARGAHIIEAHSRALRELYANAPQKEGGGVVRALRDAIETIKQQTEEAAKPKLRLATRDGEQLDLPDFATARQRVSDAIDTPTQRDRLFRATLVARRLDQITRDYNHVFRDNALQRFEDEETALHRRAEEIRAEHVPTVEHAVAFLRSEEGRTKLAPLMTDATALGIHPDVAVDDPLNAHLTPAQRAAHAELARRWEPLSSTAKGHYRRVRDYYARIRAQEIDGLMDRALDFLAPESTAEQREALLQLISTPKKVADFLKMQPETLEAAGVTDPKFKAGEARRALAQIQGMRFVKGPYFPLRRFGDYVVTYQNDDYRSGAVSREEAERILAENPGGKLKLSKIGDDVWQVDGTVSGVEFFEGRGEAERRRAELAAQGDLGDVSPVLPRRQFRNIDNTMPHLVLDAVEQSIRRSALKNQDQIIDQLRSTMAMYMPEARSARLASTMQRAGVRGASEDQARVLARHAMSAPERLAWLERGAERDNALGELRSQAENRGATSADDAMVRAAVVAEIERRVEPVEEGLATRIGRRLTPFGYVWSLLSPSLPLVNTAQVHMLSVPVLGSRHGFGAASRALLAAQRAVGFRGIAAGFKATGKGFTQALDRNDYNVFDTIAENVLAKEPAASREATAALLRTLRERNLVDHTLQFDLRDMAEGGFGETKLARGADHFMSMASMLPHAFDVQNRVVVAKAAFDLSLRKGESLDAALRYAVDSVQRSEPNYAMYNKARLMTHKGPLGAFAAPMMQFKAGGQHLYDLLAVAMRDSLRSTDPVRRGEARKLLAGVALTHLAAAGALGLAIEPIRWMLAAYSLVSGDDRPWEWQADARNWAADVMGPEAAELLMKGLPRAIGIDVSNRLGLGGALNMPQVQEFTRSAMFTALGELVAGPAVANMAQVGRGALSIASGGDPTKALQDILPRPLRDLVKAGALGTDSITDSRGRTVPVAASPGDVVAQAIGFQPATLAEVREQRSAIYAAQNEMQKGRQRLVDRWASADPAARMAVMQQIREWSMEHPAWRIDYSQLLRAQQSRQRALQNPSLAGGVALPRDQRQAAELAARGRFANP